MSKACSEHKEERLRGGHVTGSFAGGSPEGLQRAGKPNLRSRSTDLAKLNP